MTPAQETKGAKHPLVRVRYSTWLGLRAKKEHPRESMDDVISRLLGR